MPSNLKKMVRARMAETGEGWAAALRHVRAQETVPGYRCDWDGCRTAVARDGDCCPAHACNATRRTTPAAATRADARNSIRCSAPSRSSTDAKETP